VSGDTHGGEASGEAGKQVAKKRSSRVVGLQKKTNEPQAHWFSPFRNQ
jgi:hypothetical protein